MRALLIFASVLVSFACFSQATSYDFPNPVDTNDKEITIQEKKTYRQNNLFIDNQFDGARISDLTFINDFTVSIQIDPENEPINKSPWYAFRLWTNGETKNVSITLNYFEGYQHRYWPKSSNDRVNWSRLPDEVVQIAADTLSASFSITVNSDTTWIAAQPLETSENVRAWSNKVAEHELGEFSVIGKSRKDRDLMHVRLGQGKRAVVLISRQHPPEVTGYYALQSFIGEIIKDTDLSTDFLEKHTVLMYPLLNPDGVDMGHWRHNTGGVDLNRDWAYYRQSEIRQIADHIVKTVNEEGLEVVAGLDFHSTLYDVYYTTDREVNTKFPSFTDDWLQYIADNIPDYEINDQPSGLGSPVSKGWFITQFNVPGITYEIGDDTSKEFIQKKGKVAAVGLMKYFLEN